MLGFLAMVWGGGERPGDVMCLLQDIIMYRVL